MQRLTQSAQNDNDDLISEVTAAIERAVTARTKSALFGDREQAALDVGNEATRRLLESYLQRLADAEGDEVHHDVHIYRRHQPGEVKYHSLCGALYIRRSTYRSIGVRNGPTIVPLELRAGLIENATPALAYAVAQGYAKAPIRSVEKDLRAARRAPPSRATLERMAKAIGTDAKQSLMGIERRLRAKEALPKGATGISIGMDRTTIPMEEELDQARTTHGKARIAVHYRMAFVGTVAITNRDGDVLKSWRYAVPAHEGGRQVARRVINDVRRALECNPRLHIGVVQDGAPEVWNLVCDALAEAGIQRKRWHEAIDMFHLFERVATALEVVEPDAEKRCVQLGQWKRRILHDDSTICRIANFFELTVASMPRTWRRRSVWRWNEQQRRKVDDLLGVYLLNVKHFHYSEMVRLGLHVGSGVTEGACKSLIAARAKRSGQRWRPQGISSVLTLRTLVESERFDAFWKRFAPRYAPLAHAA